MTDSFYLAPLQGYTKVWYRNAYHNVMGDATKYFTPFFEEHKSGGFDPRLLPELDEELNAGMNLIPQITAADDTFLLKAYKAISEMGYQEVNLNMGCPFPMLVKRNKGGGLMDKPEMVEKMLDGFYNTFPDARLSIKMRSGLDCHSQGVSMAKLLNRFPITELIIHPRLVTQQYKGDPNWDAFEDILQISIHNIVANGDINSTDNFHNLKLRFNNIDKWMMGRGWLTNPSLVKEIKGAKVDETSKKENLLKLHNYFKKLTESQEDLALQYKHQLLVQFWQYPAQQFENGSRWLRKLSKTKDIESYTGMLRNTYE